MKCKIFILLIIVIGFISCKKDPAIKKPVIDYSKFVTIKQGVWGLGQIRTGDCELGSTSCNLSPIKTTIYIYQATSSFDTLQAVPVFWN